MHTGWKYQTQADAFDQLSPWGLFAIGVGLYLIGSGLYYFVTAPIVMLTSAA